jgi:hypothetical protein
MLSRASVPKQAIITQLAGVPTPDLASFARQLRDLPHGSHVPLQYYVFGERHRRKTAIMHIDRNWYASSHCMMVHVIIHLFFNTIFNDFARHYCFACTVFLLADGLSKSAVCAWSWFGGSCLNLQQNILLAS